MLFHGPWSLDKRPEVCWHGSREIEQEGPGSAGPLLGLPTLIAFASERLLAASTTVIAFLISARIKNPPVVSRGFGDLAGAVPQRQNLSLCGPCAAFVLGAGQDPQRHTWNQGYSTCHS